MGNMNFSLFYFHHFVILSIAKNLKAILQQILHCVQDDKIVS